MDTVLTRIMFEMKQNGISQLDLCERLNLSKYNFTDWKAGKSRSYTKYIYQISDILGVSVEYLKGETDIKQKSPSVDELSERDLIMLKAIRRLTEEQQQSILGVMQSMVEKQKEEGKS